MINISDNKKTMGPAADLSMLVNTSLTITVDHNSAIFINNRDFYNRYFASLINIIE